MRSKWITHRGKRLFYADFGNLGVDTSALQAEIDEVINALCQEPLNSVTVLTNVTGTAGTPDALARMQATVTKTTPHVHQRAVVGLSGIRKGFLDLINRFTGKSPLAAFDGIEEAKDYLANS